MVTMSPARPGAPFTRADRDAWPADGRRHELIDGCLVITSPGTRPVTLAELDALRDANPSYRYELIEGALLVTPSPSERHQDAVLGLAIRLTSACPEHLKVMVAPFDLAYDEATNVQPDLLVKDRGSAGGRSFVPYLAVEVHSPSTRRSDLTLKRLLYQDIGCPSYWVVDPDEPSLTAWELHGSEYVEVAHVTGEESWSAAQPFPVTITPAALLR